MADGGEFWAGVIIAGIIGGIAYYNKPSPPVPLPAPPVGRYVSIIADNKTFILDTSTGKTWRWVYDHLNEKGVPVGWQWESIGDLPY